MTATNARAAESEAAAAPIEVLTVTGTKIRGVAPTGSAVTTMSAVDIEAAPQPTADQLLRRLPQMSVMGANEGVVNGQFDAASNRSYGTGVNLRSLGPDATLVLVNSHRIARSGTFANFTDASVIPTIAIERVEVVADGASAIYGSDAVGGVVNLVLRDRFDGVRTSLRGGMGDGFDEWQASGLLGHRWSSGSIMLAVERQHRDNLPASKRDYYTQDMRRFGGGDYRSNRASPGNIILDGVSYAIPPNQNGVGLQPSDLIAGQTNLTDRNEQTDVLPQQDRENAVLMFSQDLGDRLRLTGDAFYSNREFDIRPAGATAGVVNVPNTNPFFVHPTDPTATSVPVSYSYVNDLGPRNDVGYSRDVGFSGNLEWDLTDSWRMQGSSYWSRNESYRAQHNTVNNTLLAAALADPDPATALNVFGVGGNNNPATIDSFRAQSDVNPSNSIWGFGVQADGPLFAIPGGLVRLAVGASYTEEEFKLKNSDSVSGPYRVTATGQTRRNSRAAFAELSVPIFSSANAIPGIERLTVSLAGRIEEFSNSVGRTDNPKYGITWSPLDQLDIRASYGTSFKAPSIAYTLPELARLVQVSNVIDPRNGQQVQALLRSGGNPELVPETAETFSVGFDWRPTFIEGAQLSLTYFSVDYDNRVGNPGIDLNLLDVYAQYVMQDPSVATVTPYLNGDYGRFVGVRPDPADVRYILDQRFQNLGSFKTSGFDLSMSYDFDTAIGGFTLLGSATNIRVYENQVARGLGFIDRLDTAGWPQSWRARAEVEWRNDAWNASLSANYVGSYENDTIPVSVGVDSFTTADLSVGYSLPIGGIVKDARLRLTVQNLFDEDPPFVEYVSSGVGLYGFDPAGASALGRVVGLGITADF